MRYLTLTDVLQLHGNVMQHEGQQSVLIDLGKLEAALARPQTESFGHELFPTLVEKAAALAQAVIIAHPFLDGNKRAGLACVLGLYDLNGREIDAPEDELYEWTIGIASGALRDLDQITARLKAIVEK